MYSFTYLFMDYYVLLETYIDIGIMECDTTKCGCFVVVNGAVTSVKPACFTTVLSLIANNSY